MDIEISWSAAKNVELKQRYGIGFERVLTALAEGGLLDEREHPNSARHANQRQWVVEIDTYAWVVPFVAEGRTVFLKTLYPSRRATRDYLGGRHGPQET